ncbi:MAG TPA: neutral/alkaline non-lysosomal ceramidase N-terminal domain-containing protein [Candidatus Bathyarchaeia archaeon]|nr:neutral/alkaline non-lysosomal ceramidase N-terminal domain-containing protein [Candidatus Bathyarchaeia archaeon]
MKNALFLSLLLLCASSAHAVMAGAARADITPDPAKYRVPLAGYGARMGKPATGIHDPLHARVLVLKDGGRQLALITCDLRSITPELKRLLIEKISAQGFTADNVFMSASHTHDGPSMYPERFWQMQFGKYDPAIMEVMSAAIAKAVAEAVATAAPVKVAFAETTVPGFANNRRWGYDTDARTAAGESPLISENLWLMRLDKQDGSTLAVLTHFATHPTILGADNMLISGDWPGAFQREMERAFPGTVALYMNGAEGDQSPKGAQGDDPFARVEDFGSRLAKVAAAAAKDLTPKDDLVFSIARKMIPLPEFNFPQQAKEKYAKYLDAAMEALPREVELQEVLLGNTLLVGLPGEPLLVCANEVREKVQGFPRVLTVGLANDYIGYIVTPAEWAHGGYEVESRSYYGPNLAGHLATQAAALALSLK